MYPIYIDVRGELTLGLVHPAEGSGPAVVICPPFGREEVASYRSRLEWAESLAAAGMPVLRFDLPGTGDSSGGPDDSDRVGAWIAGVAAAAVALRAETGRQHTAVIGIGVGGLVALAAAADGAAVDDLVLWGVPARGRQLVRELEAFARIESATIVAAGGPEPPPPTADEIGPGGFALSAETRRSLERLELADLLPTAGAPGARRVLLLGRDGIAPDDDLRHGLEERGVQVDAADGPGYGGMMTVLPEDARLPPLVRERVQEWLLAAGPAATKPPAVRSRSPVAARVAELTVGGTRLRETPLAITHAEGRVFGVLSESVDVPSSGLTLVLLNGGAIRHIGPSRLWVGIARWWAARGVATFRVDLEGIGDASGDADRRVDVADLYSLRYVSQVRAVLDELVARGTHGPFVLLGLCAGAFWAFHAALADDRVSLALMLNPRLLFWHPEIQSARDARNRRRQLLRAGSWRRILGGKWWTVVGRLLVLSASTVVEPLRLHARSRAHVETRAATEAAFDRLARSAARAVFVFCDGEPLRDELAAAGLLTRAGRRSHVELVELPGRDHVLRPLWMHKHVEATVADVLETELRRVSEVAEGARSHG